MKQQFLSFQNKHDIAPQGSHDQLAELAFGQILTIYIHCSSNVRPLEVQKV